MGESRTREVHMVALILLLLGMVILLAAAGRIWIDPGSLKLNLRDTETRHLPGQPHESAQLSGNRDSSS
ncbi:MAG: hypothetical protein NBKEAIPA_02040 [Nitrospirae bacterium]|nr:hypothetical protein [Nitrospirota bacterium]QOJ34994.1 MAG: hypothetical protein HRU82_08560 [Nitrospira sp.]